MSQIPPHPIIDAQLEAYRARDVEKFASFYSDEVKVYRDGDLVIDGIAQLRAMYAQLFDESPNLAIEIAERKIERGSVYDVELITGLRGNAKQIRADVRYKLAALIITEVVIKWIDDVPGGKP